MSLVSLGERAVMPGWGPEPGGGGRRDLRDKGETRAGLHRRQPSALGGLALSLSSGMRLCLRQDVQAEGLGAMAENAASSLRGPADLGSKISI